MGVTCGGVAWRGAGEWAAVGDEVGALRVRVVPHPGATPRTHYVSPNRSLKSKRKRIPSSPGGMQSKRNASRPELGAFRDRNTYQSSV